MVLFLPWLLLTGRAFPEELAVLLFCTIGFLGSVWLFHRLARSFQRTSPILLGAGVIALGFASGIPTLLLRPAVYEVAISCGYALVILAVVFIERALDQRRGWERWLALASVAFGFAIAARPPILFGALALLVPVVAAYRRTNAVSSVKGLAAAVVPILVLGLVVMVYNAGRFGSPFEF
ncbi:MAG: hypothetical protein ABIZ81_15125, partial [Opitutaceae bacterium]